MYKKMCLGLGLGCLLLGGLVVKDLNSITEYKKENITLNSENKKLTLKTDEMKKEISSLRELTGGDSENKDNNYQIINRFLDTMFNFKNDETGSRLNGLVDIVSPALLKELHPVAEDKDSPRYEEHEHSAFSDVSCRLSNVDVYKGATNYYVTYTLNYTYGDNQKLKQDMSAKIEVEDGKIISYDVVNGK